MYFARNVDRTLASWATEPDRKPLVLRGGRQVGKSSAVRRLGRSFELYLELNLERQPDLALARGCHSAEELLQALAARENVARFPARTLLFLDEIQESPEMIHWLRFFREDHPELAVVAAGSLLEVRLQDRGFSFPVGRVTFRTLRPMTFFEFLGACGKEVLADRLASDLAAGQGSGPALHQQALDLLRDYLLVGGMPEAVSRWVEARNPAAVRQVHGDLVQAFAEDIQKYRQSSPAADLEVTFAHLRHHYGRRFHYEGFVPGFKSARTKAALEKLEGALIIERVWPTSSLALPLAVRPKSAPRLLPLDVGLALYEMGTSREDLRTHPLEGLLAGRLAEIFVGQQLQARDLGPGEPLLFWVSESSRANAETDYLVPGPGFPVPVEVKSGAAGSLKSLHQFLWRAGLSLGVRFHSGRYADERLTVQMADGPLAYRLLSVPMYLAEKVNELLGGGGD